MEPTTSACTNCLSCILQFLKRYRMYCNEYKNLYQAYKYLLTLSMTQVTCERYFSKLTHTNLESF